VSSSSACGSQLEPNISSNDGKFLSKLPFALRRESCLGEVGRRPRTRYGPLWSRRAPKATRRCRDLVKALRQLARRQLALRNESLKLPRLLNAMCPLDIEVPNHVPPSVALPRWNRV
jgi:hypothetical protein